MSKKIPLNDHLFDFYQEKKEKIKNPFSNEILIEDEINSWLENSIDLNAMLVFVKVHRVFISNFDINFKFRNHNKFWTLFILWEQKV